MTENRDDDDRVVVLRVVLHVGNDDRDAETLRHAVEAAIGFGWPTVDVEDESPKPEVPSRYLVVGGGATLSNLQAYLYSQDSVLSHVQTTVGGVNGSAERLVAVVQVRGSDEDNAAYRGQYVTGRLESGGFGVTLHETLDEANAESVVRRVLLGV